MPRLVLNWAVAQALAGDRDGLELMRDRYGIQMARTDLREPFALLTSSTAEFSDIQEVAAQVSQAESFRKYLANLSEDFAPEG